MGQAYSDMKQNAAVTESGIDAVFQQYATIMSSLKNDSALNMLLGTDYAERSYVDLAVYSYNTLDKLLVLYPSVSWLRFYSNNDTLPDDHHYFYQSRQLNEEIMMKAEEARGIPIAAGFFAEDEDDIIMLVSCMNYYASDTAKNYLALGIRKASMEELLYQKGESTRVYLLDQSGKVLASTDQEAVMEAFQDILASWQEMPEDEICLRKDSSGTELICLKSGMDMGMDLVMTVDRSVLLGKAKEVPKRTMAVFMVISLIALLFALANSRFQTQQLQKIIGATNRIGEGDFRYKLEDVGRDEFGQIAGAVNRMNDRINSLIRENYERELLLRTAEMNLLQEQINPHFLYNALTVISSVSVREGARETVQSVRYLADFYRMSLNKGKQVITVQEEVELLRNYMKIQTLRFSDTLEISYHIKPEVFSCKTIKLILQPLVENAIHHGQEEGKVLHIKVEAGCMEERVYYEVEDDGAGIAPDKLEALRRELAKSEEGFGLKNVDIRIKLNYGEQYGVRVDSTYGEGTRVHVEIPRIESR